jgi:hypothetical protein
MFWTVRIVEVFLHCESKIYFLRQVTGAGTGAGIKPQKNYLEWCVDSTKAFDKTKTNSAVIITWSKVETLI